MRTVHRIATPIENLRTSLRLWRMLQAAAACIIVEASCVHTCSALRVAGGVVSPQHTPSAAASLAAYSILNLSYQRGRALKVRSPVDRPCLLLCSKLIPGQLHASSMPTTDAAFFWMPDDVPYGGFSHWYHANMLDDEGNKFPTVEHYMMYHKAKLFGDKVVAEDILCMQTPDEAKAAGRRVQGFDKELWTARREQIVFDGNFLKFTQHKQLQALLLRTGKKPLVEASPEDRLWGIGYSAADAEQHRDKWGQNLCGKAIERVREKLQHI